MGFKGAGVIKRFRKRFLRTVYYVAPLLLWMGVIYVSSTDRGAYDVSLRLMLRAGQWAVPGWQPPWDVGVYYPLNDALRKLAHVLFFGIFTLLTVRAVQWGSPRLKLSSVLVVLGIGIVFSLSDALVRLAAPERHVRLEQFLMNGLGAVLVLVMVTGFFAAKAWERRLQEGERQAGSESANKKSAA